MMTKNFLKFLSVILCFAVVTSIASVFLEQNSSGNDRLRSTGNDVDLAPAGTTGDPVLWQQIDASSSYFYIQNVDNNKRLRAVNATTVDLAPAGTTGNQVEWQLQDYDGTWSFIISRSEGRKLHAKSSEGWVVNIVDPQWTGPNVQWKVVTNEPRVTTPGPADGSIDVVPELTFSWVGENVTSPAYFINIGTTSACDDILSNHSVGSSTSYFASGILNYDTDYFWRIDIVDGGQTYPGPVWEFTTGDGRLWVEDFFYYSDTADLLTVWSENIGADITYEPLTNIMQIDYDNTASPYRSDVSITFSPVEDWSGSLSSLNMKFLGQQGNSSEPVSITLTDATTSQSHTVLLTDAITDLGDVWQELSVQLSEFQTNGVDLSAIQTLNISIGDGLAGGSGTVFINDIILYPPRCLSHYANIADITGDCQVTIDDLELIISDWLYENFIVNAVVPGSAVVYYAFEETSGLVAADALNGYDATITPAIVSGFWNSDGYAGRCIEIADPNLEVNMPTNVFSMVSDEMTVSVWIYGQTGMIPEPVETVELSAGIAPAEANTWDLLQWDIVSTDQYEAWNHYALVKDASAGLMQIYVNGILVAQKTDATAILSGASAGHTVLSLVPGHEVSTVKVDELQIYDVALTPAEIVYLAKGPSGQITQPIWPVLTQADIISDGIVNIKDIAQLASVWLVDQHW